MKDRIKKIKVLALDVDGVLTDGKIVFDSNGAETKFFDVQDGFGIVFFRKAGFKTAIVTARASKVVTLRAADLEIDKVYLDAFPKTHAYEKMLRGFKVKDNEVCFVGDDLPDLPVLKRVGFAVAVANAVPEVKKAAHYVTKKKGGNGAVREVVELILKTQGKWQGTLARYA
ncbi:MAG TPA: HAD-IIIA family hydrolase [Candidatus Omnitrophota bacterium]|nr:HAD-IIIA family hydrolase [Candidatus Omnitrophota bacterium]HPD84992.1 HAD-IIIA family hydrolase [Candidatus Omnitrophota bacterium]HRZ03850.1 HAD-IIIA family hydrolase [Candidatus Omnitrophota bacterium]